MAWINGGKFNGQQIIPESYVKEAMSPQMIMANSIRTKSFRKCISALMAMGGWFHLTKATTG